MTLAVPPDGDGAEVIVRPTDDVVVGPGKTPPVPVVDAAPVAERDPVQQVYGRIIGGRDADRRPVVPTYLRTKDARRELAGWAVKYAAHAAAFHALRLPLYAGRLALRAPVGLFVVLGVLARWVFDAESRPLRSAAIGRVSGSAGGSTEATRDYLALTRVRNERVKRRGITAAVAAVPVLIGASWWWWYASALPFWTITAAGLAVLGFVGAPPDRPIVTRAVLATLAPRPTAPMVERALRTTGVAGMTGKDAVISFPSEVAREGPGWRVDVDLPHGVTVGEVLDRREKLASGLRRPTSAVWPEADADAHAGRLVLWVGDQPLSKQRPRPWPLAKAGSVEILAQAFPFGSDPRGRNVSLSLAEANVLIGSLPGGGKSAALRVLACAAVLDPYAEVRIFEHKGTKDFGPLEKCCHRYANGVADEEIEQTLISLREVVRDLERRAAVIAKLPREMAPDRKVTPALAKRAGLGLHPLVMIVDECQEVFSHPEYGGEAGKLAEKIIRRGRALGVILILATQRPDKDSLPTGVSANAGIRFCLRVMGQTENDMILGTSAYKNGIRATTLSPSERGVGYLVGVGDAATVLRTYYLDGPASEPIADRAHAARVAAGTLSGHAVGDDAVSDPGPTFDLLSDLAVIIETHGNPAPRSGKGVGRGRWLWSDSAVGALEVLRPEVYRGWDAEALGKALAARGVPTGQMYRTDADGDRRNLVGFDEAGITEARGEPGAPDETPE